MFKPVPLNLPPFPFKIKEDSGNTYIFDPIRKKYIILTPEEWVRQHLAQFLIIHKKYPTSLFNIEGGLKLNSLQKRTDLVIYNSIGEKILLVECKAPSVKISQKTFDQIARYNIVHKIPLLLVSNGIHHYTCTINFEQGSYEFLPDIPPYTKT
ncbi:type I restriction enzyme HsdR N-terminal domain-containing protein [Rubrolithibacter danxiaensis]|uniref:type I restriction enzyme HsdR N-terminal domain-containing protein n=1 Tax=Rubrolithibacter danxiaensis TaxID=3390805 RepID=UPI003BF7A5BA